MALWVAGQLAGEDVARVIELALEYDPDPPHGTGSPEAAGPVLKELGRHALRHLFEHPLLPETAAALSGRA